jgi:hypothetical protein
MAIENVSSTSTNVPNREQVSVIREDDGSLSISITISVDAGSTASADDESSSDSAAGADQAKSDEDSTDTSYPTDQPGVSEDIFSTLDEAVMTDMKDLLATIDEAIKLLGGESGDSAADELQSVVGEVPVAASPTVLTGSDDRDFAERLEGVVADLEITINDAAGSDNSELAEFLEGVVADFEETIYGPDCTV